MIVLAIVGRDPNDSQTSGAEPPRSFVRDSGGVLAFPYSAEIAWTLRKKRTTRRTALMAGLNQDVRSLYRWSRGYKKDS